MDIAAISMGLSQAKLSQDVGVSLLKKILDVGEGEAAEMAKLLESSKAIELAALPHLGSRIDVEV